MAVRTVNIFLGFFFVVNFCIGTGFLGVPYGFFYSGYLASIPTLIVIATVSWINATYVLEVMARAQALEYFDFAQKPVGLNEKITDDSKHPIFEISLRRKFEIVELCEIFFNKWVKYLYLVILSIYCFLAAWSFSTVGGSSWALNVPYHFGRVNTCASDAFHHSVLPTDEGCRNAYYFSLFIFAVIVVTLSLLDLKEQAIIQMILGLLRFLTVLAIIIYSITRVVEGGNACTDVHGSPNISEDVDNWFGNFDHTNSSNITNSSSITIRDIVVKFDPKSWLTTIPIFTYAFILHQGIASLTHPIKQKRHMWYLILAMFLTAITCYMSLGVIAPLWFNASVQETVTLNFGELTSSDHTVALRLLAYYVILFPSVDVVSAYPLMTHTVVNNVYIIIVGRDTSIQPPSEKKWRDFILRISLRLVIAIIPILAAFGVANLVYVLKYAGLMGFNVCFFFPTMLQLRSIYVCQRTFAPNRISISDGGTLHEKEERQSLLTVSSSAPLSVQRVKGKKQSSQYMTPFSSRVFSHPVAVVTVGVLGVCFFLLTLASLAVKPVKVTCDSV